MKKHLIFFIVLIITTFATISSNAAEIDITINGTKSNFNSEAMIINDRTYVPARDLFENIGATVRWDENTNMVTATFENKAIKFKIGSNIFALNGTNHISALDTKLINDKAYIPLRYILELLNFDVNWNKDDMIVDISSNQTSNDSNNEINTPESSINSNNESNYELRVLQLVNIERNKKGLNSLKLDEDLSNIAKKHCEDMAKRNYFSHINPDGMSPVDRLLNYGISYSRSAENIAAGQSTPELVVKSWMESQGHRENILNADFNKIGIGYFYADKNYIHYWTQCFTD